MLFFAIAAFGAGWSDSVAMLVFFRGLQALGASIIFVVSAALLSDVFPERERVRAISIYGGVTGFGLMIGPFLGGMLVGWLGWRWVFWINLPLIAIGLASCSFSLKGSDREEKRVAIDWMGLLLLIIGLGALMEGIVWAAQTNGKSPYAWALLVIGLTALIALVFLDEKKKNPLLDLPILKQPLIVLSALSCALAGVVSTVFMFFDPLYLRTVRSLSPFLIGLMIAAIPAAQAVISLVFSQSVRRFGVALLLYSSILIGTAAVVLHRWIGASTPLLFLLIPFFLLGVNWGLSNSAMITAVNQVFPPRKIGAALGTIATLWNITGALLLALSSALFHSIERTKGFLPAFHGAVLLNAALTLLLLIVGTRTYLSLRKKANP